MKLLPEGKSKALSGLALGVAAVCGLMGLKAARDLVILMDVFSTPAFFLGLVRATVPVEMPPLARFIVHNIRLFFIFFVFFWLSGFVLALGVWGRREWARSGAVAMLYLLSAAALLMLLFPWLAIPRPLFYGKISLSPEFNEAVLAAAYWARITSLLTGSLCLWWGLALDRGELRKEFSGTGSKAVPARHGEPQVEERGEI